MLAQEEAETKKLEEEQKTTDVPVAKPASAGNLAT